MGKHVHNERLIKQTDLSQEKDNSNLMIDLQIVNILAWNGGAKIKKFIDNIENIIISLNLGSNTLHVATSQQRILQLV